jgi:peptidoglycan/LPS O-acetylase OafA/YrhL
MIDRHNMSHIATWSFAFGFLVLGIALMPVRVIVNRAMAFIGRISYSMYIVHFVVIVWAVQRINPTTIENEGLRAVILAALVFPATVAISAALFYFFERPTTRFGASVADRLAQPIAFRPLLARLTARSGLLS